MTVDWLQAAIAAVRRNGHLLVAANNLPWSFLLAPGLAGALLLTAFAYVWHRRGLSPALAAALVVGA